MKDPEAGSAAANAPAILLGLARLLEANTSSAGGDFPYGLMAPLIGSPRSHFCVVWRHLSKTLSATAQHGLARSAFVSGRSTFTTS